jgi:uncharacterized membrane protein YkvA (DUF1232 family)
VLQSFLNWYRSGLRHPKYRWLIVFGTLAYLLSPIDISPDLVPILGQIDDTMLIMLLLGEVYQIAMEWVQSRREDAEAAKVSTDASTSSQEEKTTTQTVDVKSVSID